MTDPSKQLFLLIMAPFGVNPNVTSKNFDSKCSDKAVSLKEERKFWDYIDSAFPEDTVVFTLVFYSILIHEMFLFPSELSLIFSFVLKNN